MENQNEKTQFNEEYNSIETPQNEEKRNNATVVSAAAGIAGGAAIGVGAAALWPNSAEAAEVEDVNTEDDVLIEKAEAPSVEPEVVTQTTVHHVHIHHEPEPVHAPQAEVTEFAQVVDSEGNHVADMASVKVEGENIVYLDNDLNGEADIAWYDANHNQMVDEGEIVDVTDSHINMNTLQQAAANTTITVVDSNPEPVYDAPGIDYTADASHDLSVNTDMSNDMPDYVNDADVDSFVG